MVTAYLYLYILSFLKTWNVFYSAYVVVFFYKDFFKEFFLNLFVRDTHREERQRHRQGEKQAPCREPSVGLDPGSPELCPGVKAGAKPLSRPGCPRCKVIE